MDGQALKNAFQETQQHLLKLLNDLSAIRALADINLHHTSEPGLLHDAMRILMENSDIERCSIFILNDNTLQCVGGMGWSDILPPEPESYTGPAAHSFNIGEGIAGLAAKTGQLQHCRNSRREPQFAHPLDRAAIGSLISVPLCANKIMLGVLNVSHSRPHSFNTSHERLLLLFCTVLAQMLSNLRYGHHMEQEVRERTSELEGALEEMAHLKHRYQELSMIDELTGIHNRRYFFPEATASLANALRYRQPFSLMMIDLDRFKNVNDSYGHDTGDKVLRVAAALLKGQTREGDVIARFGGEEFIMVLPNTDRRGATQLAERILESLRTVAFNSGDTSIHVTACIGISSLNGTESPDQKDLLEQLLREADRALYFGKNSGRDQVRNYGDVATA